MTGGRNGDAMKNGWLRKIPVVLAAVFLFLLTSQTALAAENAGTGPEILPFGAAMAAMDFVRVRLGPSVDFPVAGTLEPGQAVNVCGRTADGWYEVVFGNGIGYVNGKLLVQIPVDETMLAALAAQAEWVKAYQAQAASQEQTQIQLPVQAEVQAEVQTEAQEQVPAPAVDPSQPQLLGNVIFVGDSRVGQMANAVGGPQAWPQTAFVSCYGGGVDWLSTNKAKADVDQYVTPGSVILLNYGVNDLSHHQEYINLINKYNQDWRKKGAVVYEVFVGPVGESNCYGKTNWSIEYFNDRLSGGLDGSIGRINLYSYLRLTGYETLSDGIHYTADTYARIFQFLMQSIGRGSV